MSCMSIEELRLNALRKLVFQLQSDLEVLLAGCDVLKSDSTDKLRALGFSCTEIISEIDSVKNDISSLLCDIKGLDIVPLSDEGEVRSRQDEVFNLKTRFNDVEARVERIISEARNNALQKAQRLSFSVNSHVSDAADLLSAERRTVLSSNINNKEIEMLLTDDSLPQSFRNNIKALYDLVFIQTEESALNALLNQIGKKVKLAEEYKQTKKEYRSQSIAFGIRPKEYFELTPFGIEEMKKAMHEDAKSHSKSVERKYIRIVFDSIMSELGYNVSGFHDDSYTTLMYRIPGNQDIVLEVIQDGKQVTIEFAADEDKAERASVTSSMLNWCSRDRDILLRKLGEYGIITKTTFVLPPDPDAVHTIHSASSVIDDAENDTENNRYHLYRKNNAASEAGNS